MLHGLVRLRAPSPRPALAHRAADSTAPSNPPLVRAIRSEVAQDDVEIDEIDDVVAVCDTTHGGHESPKNDNTWLRSVKMIDPSPLTSALKGPEPGGLAPTGWPK